MRIHSNIKNEYSLENPLTVIELAGNKFLSHNPGFQCNIAITNFLVSNTCEIRFHGVIGQSTVPIYFYAKIPIHG